MKKKNLIEAYKAEEIETNNHKDEDFSSFDKENHNLINGQQDEKQQQQQLIKTNSNNNLNNKATKTGLQENLKSLSAQVKMKMDEVIKIN